MKLVNKQEIVKIALNFKNLRNFKNLFHKIVIIYQIKSLKKKFAYTNTKTLY